MVWPSLTLKTREPAGLEFQFESEGGKKPVSRLKAGRRSPLDRCGGGQPSVPCGPSTGGRSPHTGRAGCFAHSEVSLVQKRRTDTPRVKGEPVSGHLWPSQVDP